MKTENYSIKNFLTIPDIISLANATCGLISIFLALNNYLGFSAILIIIAMMFDSVDGWVARKLNKSNNSEFGKNIDSLSDIISFGIAPAILFYTIGKSTNGPLLIISIVAIFMMICGILRLTRYNVIADYLDFKGFIGFPIPGIGIILSTFYLSGIFNIYVAIVLMIITSLLMISDLKYLKLNNIPTLIFATILIILILLPIDLIFKGINIPAFLLLIICLTYLFSALIKRN